MDAAGDARPHRRPERAGATDVKTLITADKVSVNGIADGCRCVSLLSPSRSRLEQESISAL
jgi:hypothetical protein